MIIADPSDTIVILGDGGTLTATRVEDIARPRNQQMHHGIDFVPTAVDRVDVEGKQVHLENGLTLDYDIFVAASAGGEIIFT